MSHPSRENEKVRKHSHSSLVTLAGSFGLVTFLSFFSSAAGLCKEAIKAESNGYKGLLIRQNTPNQGTVTIRLCPHRWVMKGALITIIVDEEKDTVYAYTRQTNKYLQDTLKAGERRFENFRRRSEFKWGPFIKTGPAIWNGEKAMAIERRGTRVDMAVKNDVVVTERQLSLPRLQVSKVFQEICYALMAEDYKDGMVVHVERTAHSANPHYCTVRPVVTLDTVSIKEQTFLPIDFKLPGGMTRVSSEMELFTNDDSGMKLEDINEKLLQREKQLDIDSLTGSKKQH